MLVLISVKTLFISFCGVQDVLEFGARTHAVSQCTGSQHGEQPLRKKTVPFESLNAWKFEVADVNAMREVLSQFTASRSTLQTQH